MKTNLVEIFQTIRASLQPYTANGFAARTNSETIYELWTEKEIDPNGEKIESTFFAKVKIENEKVKFCLASSLEAELHAVIGPGLLGLSDGQSCFKITQLDDRLLEQINDLVVVAFTFYKQQGWV